MLNSEGSFDVSLFMYRAKSEWTLRKSSSGFPLKNLKLLNVCPFYNVSPKALFEPTRQTYFIEINKILIKLCFRFALQKHDDHTELRFKILVVGEIASGKTSFIHRYVNNMFTASYKPTVIDSQKRHNV